MVGASARNAVAAGDKARWLADKRRLIVQRGLEGHRFAANGANLRLGEIKGLCVHRGVSGLGRRISEE
jgi:hypothetical protein